VTQAYVSMMESSKRLVPDGVARKAARALNMPATALPVAAGPTVVTENSNDMVVKELARLGYPGFAYLRNGRATQNPADLLLRALAPNESNARVFEALPWLLLRFDDLDVELVVRSSKLHDFQNRLGFVVALAREVAQHNKLFRHRLDRLRSLERRLEDSRLAREDTFGRPVTERMRAWLRDNRSNLAKHWNLLTDVKAEHLSYAGHNS
jgi:hypothetical protein